MTPILILLAATAAQGTAVPAVPAEGEARARACEAQVRGNPAEAATTAAAWLAAGGGLAARQCLGLAHVALERWAPAATAFEEGARAAEAAQDPRRADFWVQSGNAWLAAGDQPRALTAFDAALATPGLTDEMRGEAHLDRARALVASGSVARARTDMDRALQLVPADPFVWYLSAALARRENAIPRAQSDIARALQLAPGNPDIALLAGTIAGLAGNMAEAERLYRQVAAAAPDSDAGRAALASLPTVPAPPASSNAVPANPAPARPQPQSR